jgi:chromosome segregation ATPase
MEFLAPLIAALRPALTAEAVKVLDQIAAKAASGAEPDIRQAERDLLAWLARRDCGHGAHLAVITERLDRIDNRLETLMSEQSQLDADVQSIEGSVAAIAAAVTAVQAELSALQNSNPALDLTGLNQAVSDLAGATSSVQALAPAAPPADGGDTSGDSGDGSAPVSQ